MPDTNEKPPEAKTPAHPHLNAYAIVADAVHAGVLCGHARAHKHTATPEAGSVCETVYNAVMVSLAEVLDFDSSCCLPFKEQDASEDQTS